MAGFSSPPTLPLSEDVLKVRQAPLIIRRKRSRSIKSSVSVHDRTHLEATFSYALLDRAGGQEKLRRNPCYQVDAYLFLPAQIGLTPHNYPSERFYDDLRAFIRLREPKLSFRQLKGDEKSKADNHALPINYLRNYLHGAEHGFNVDPPSAAIEETRVFACAAVAYFWKRVERRRRRLSLLSKNLSLNAGDEFFGYAVTGLLHSIQGLLSKIRELSQLWRELIQRHHLTHSGRTEAVLAEMRLVDEYLSYVFRDGTLLLMHELEALGDVCAAASSSASPGLTLLLRRMTGYLRLERWHGNKYGYFWIVPTSDQREQEAFIRRRGALKKRISSVLYLNPRPFVLFSIQRQMGAMVGASLAATWAVAASIFIWSHSDFQGYQFFANLSLSSALLICLAWVLSYVLKDRIKEAGRNVLARGLRGIQPDLVNKITYERSHGKKLVLGTVREFVAFVKTRKIPQEIRDVRRSADQRVAIENLEESVIHYTKRITMKSRALTKLHRRVRAVSDILRLSVEPFLPRLDDPLQRSFTLSEDGRIVEMHLPKVYAVDLVLQYSPLGRTRKSTEIVYDCFRLILDKHGLTRIEQINKV